MSIDYARVGRRRLAPVTVLKVRHTTIYRYNPSVVLGDHRLTLRCCASALLFFQLRIGFIRRWLRFGALGFAQRGFLVSLSLFLLAPSMCRPRSLGSISSVIWLKCHCVSRWLITHLSPLYKHVAMPLKRHVCASNYNDRYNRDRMYKRRRGRRWRADAPCCYRMR